MTIQQHDFVEVDYTGRFSDTKKVFDTTNEQVAKTAGVHSKKAHYHSAVICIGTAQIIKGIDDFLIGKELGSYTVSLSSENAFGKKNPKLLQMIPLGQFHKQKIQPTPGLSLNMDGAIGTVRTVSGGRVVVDFNHQLAGKEVTYELTVRRILQDTAEKLKAWLHQEMHLDAEVSLNNGVALVQSEHNIPASIAVEVTKKLAPILKIKTLEFRPKN
ncbi:MAG: peptidylprolyl isomerase [Candidatus Woesearchaeota archaeon]|nr:peptidylprolyl isomerase [Candidatus Woesearchaeota archaeon]